MSRRIIASSLISVSLTLFVMGFTISSISNEPKPGTFAIMGAKVVTEPGKEVTTNLLIHKGLIKEMGENISTPPDAVVIDAKETVIYPGFIDAGNTWGFESSLKRSESGPPEAVDLASETLTETKRDNRKGLTPEFDVATALKLDEETANNWRKQGVVARLAYPDGGLMNGTSVLLLHNGAVPRSAIVRAGVAQHGIFRSLGGGGGYPSTLMGSFAHVRQTLLDAGHHSRWQAAFSAGTNDVRPPFDPCYDALNHVLNQKIPLVIEADSKDEISRALNFCKEINIKPIILGATEGWKIADRLKADEVTVLLKINFADKPKTSARRRGGIFEPPVEESEPKNPERVKKDFERQHQEELKNASILASKGVKFAFVGAGLDGAGSYLAKIRKAVTNGLSAEVALKAMTTNPAEILQVDKSMGTIAIGRPAHLVGMSHYFHDEKAKIKFTFVDGIQFDYEEKKDAKKTDPKERMEELKKAIETGKERIARGKTMLEGVPADRRGRFQTMMDEAVAQLKADETELAELEKKGSKPQEAGKKDEPKTEEKPKETAKKEEPKTTDKKPDEAKKDEPKKPDQPTELEEDRKIKSKTGGNCLIKNTTILTITRGTLAGDILIEKGKIKQIGENLSAPEGFKVIDAKGLYVMPGIIDSHSHFSISGGLNEATLSIVPECKLRDCVDSEDVQIYRALAGGMTSARLLHGSANCMGGQDAVIKLKYGEASEKLLLAEAKPGVKFALGENVKRTDGRFPNTRLGVEAVYVRAFTEAQAYRQQWKDYEASKTSTKPLPEPRKDLRLDALVDILEGRVMVHCHSYRADEILMLLRVADRFGFKVKSLQHVLEGYKIAPEIAAHGASCSTFSDWWAYKIEAFDAIPHNAALLNEAGAVAILKSDSNELMRHLYIEAAKIMKYGGISSDDALKMITLNPAKQLSLDDRLGSIEVGKDADLAIFNTHPLSGFARCVMTLVEGEIYFERSDRKAAELPAFSPPPARGPELGFINIAKSAKNNYFVKNVHLHPVVGKEIRNAGVLVSDGKIQKILDLDSLDNNVIHVPDVSIMDAKGLHLFPGMIDSGTILGLTELGSARETQDYSEGGDFHPDLRAIIGINPDSELIPVTRANGVLTALSRPTGAMISGQGALINLAGWTPRDMIVKEPLGLHVEFPATRFLVSGSPDGPPMGRMFARKQREEKMRLLKEQFKQAQRDAAAKKADPTKQLDPRREALIPYATGQAPVIVQANNQNDMMEALKWADDLKVKIILSGALDSWKIADELKKRNVPVIIGPIQVMPQESFDTYDSQFAVPAKVSAAGITYCIRSSGSTNARNLPYEAAMAVSYGLSPEEGLKSVTLYPAQILGVANELGSIEVGKRANLVLCDGDILQPTTMVKSLFIDGKPVEPHSKQTHLYERYRERLKEVKAGKTPLGTAK